MEEQANKSDLETTAKETNGNPAEEKQLKWDINTFLRPERQPDEEFNAYKERQKLQKMYLKGRLKGRLWWMSLDLNQPMKGLTYNKEQYKKALEIYNKQIKEKENV